MLKLAICAVASATISATATFQAVTAPATADDRCWSLGYRSCLVIDGVSHPTTADPKIRADLTRFVRQTSRDRL